MTIQEVLEAAYAKSTENTPEVIASESTELLEVVYRALCGLYAVAARVNRTWFSTRKVVPAVAGGWPRPIEAEMVYRIERPTGKKVAIVPMDDRTAERLKAAVFEEAQVFYPAGNEFDPPTTEQLTFVFSARPTKPANLDASIDPKFPESNLELLALEVAMYLSLKDGREARGQEFTTLREERNVQLKRYIAFLEHSTVGMVRRHSHQQRFNSHSLVSLTDLLAGGASAQ